MKTIVKLLLLTIGVLLISLGTISATDNSTITQDTTQTPADQTLDVDIIGYSANYETHNNINKTVEKNEKTGNNREKSATTITITSSNYDSFFKNQSDSQYLKSTDLIKAGDTINLKGTFKNMNFVVDKRITLTSINRDARLINSTVYVLGPNASGSTVKNLNIYNNGTLLKAIQVKNSSKLLVENNEIETYGLRSYGFVADNMNHSTIRNNQFKRAGDDWRYLTFVMGKSFYNTIANNTLNTGGANGIYLSIYGSTEADFDGGASDHNNITGNTVSSTGYITSWCYSIQVMGANNIVSYNKVTGGFRGISTQDYENNIITHNDVHAINEGIYACEKAVVSNNNIHVENTSYAVTIGGDNVIVRDNIIKSQNAQAIEIRANNPRIINNTIISDSYGIYSKGKYTNILIENNTINTQREGILFKQQTRTKKINNVRVNNNNIVSKADYAINFEETGAVDTQDINITVTSSNVLTSNRGNGKAKAYIGPDKNDESSQQDTRQKITVNKDNYEEWFDNGISNLKVKQNATVTLMGVFNNINFTFTKKVHVIGKECTIREGTITLISDAHESTVTNVTIVNSKKTSTRHAIELIEVNNCQLTKNRITNYAEYESLGVFLYGSNGNTIGYNSIKTSGDYVNNAILLYSSDSNNIRENNITVNQSGIPVAYDDSIMFNERIGTITEILHTHAIVLIYSSSNNVDKNKITARSMFKQYTFPTNNCKNSIVGIDVYFDSHYNTISSNDIDIKSMAPYIYGIGVLGGQWGSSITSNNATANRYINNTVKLSGGYFATGFIAGRNSVATTVENNKFNIYISKNTTDHGDFAHGITLENSTNTTIRNNNIGLSGCSVFSMELFDSNNNQIINNTVKATATNPCAIAAYSSSNNRITANKLTLKKTDYGTTMQAGHSDVISSCEDAISLQSASKGNTITNNTINTNSTNTIALEKQTAKNVISNNSLKSKTKTGDNSVNDNGSNNKVSNNFVYYVTAKISKINAKIGEKITITANVTATTKSTKKLKATFKLGTQTIGTVTVTDGKVKVPFNVSTVYKATTYQLTLTLSGTNFQKTTVYSQATFTKNPEKTTVKVAKVLKTIGSDAKLVANITTENGGKISSGKADFYIDGKYLFTRNVKLGKASGTYSISSNATAGVHQIKVVYRGTKDYNTSSGTNKLGIQTKSTITTGTYTATLKETVTINATIKTGEKLIKSGKVRVYINNKLICNTNIKDGIIKYKYKIPTTFDRGTYTLKFVYDGNNTQAGITKTTKIKIYPFKAVFNYTKTRTKVGKTVLLVLLISNGKTGKDKYNAMDGNVTIKLNNKLLRDNKANAIVATVKNGKITFKFTAPEQLKGLHNITFIYKGYSKFAATSKTYNNGLIID
ncbi:MAG: hypothetical protein BZ135_00805 [Methanosphaera sp. rholeuAM6]|nr:MAG: hypothetical protein BZ135_00805 [Methanosphaera sp. rholeuAM6]